MKLKVQCFTKYPVKMLEKQGMTLIMSSDEILIINLPKK